jgi:hypothetical protein
MSIDNILVWIFELMYYINETVYGYFCVLFVGNDNNNSLDASFGNKQDKMGIREKRRGINNAKAYVKNDENSRSILNG